MPCRNRTMRSMSLSCTRSISTPSISLSPKIRAYILAPGGHRQPLAIEVLTVSDAVAWLRAAFESLQVRLPLVEEMPAHAVPLGDEIFDSLRERYLGFDEWWRTKCVPDHRPCWVVSIDGEIAGLVVRKEKTHAEAKTHHRGPKILKVCTFKVKPRSRRGGGWNWVGVVSGSFNPNDSGVGALERRPRHDKGYHEGGGCRRRGFAFR